MLYYLLSRPIQARNYGGRLGVESANVQLAQSGSIINIGQQQQYRDKHGPIVLSSIGEIVRLSTRQQYVFSINSVNGGPVQWSIWIEAIIGRHEHTTFSQRNQQQQQQQLSHHDRLFASQTAGGTDAIGPNKTTEI